MKDKDAILYAQFLKGDELALEELIRIYSDNLVRFAYLYVKDSYLAEDVAEDTFVALFIKRKKFTSRAKFKTYLYKIAKNKCIDVLRKRVDTVPLYDVENVLKSASVEESRLKVGMKVKAISGTFAGYSGVLQEISEDNKQLTVLISTERRDIPVILEAKDVVADE